ncbi:MAG: ABC transporter permease subunit [Marinilabiliales bacterium]|nr:ABC transporter permease subunit [Marinilabiliales bacterium]
MIIVLLGLIILYNILTQDLYATIFGRIASGLWVTVRAAVISYAFALIIGLIVALGRVSKIRSRTIWRRCTSTSFAACRSRYRSFMWHSVIAPALVALLNGLGDALDPGVWAGGLLAKMTLQDIESEVRVIIALAPAYGGFEAETFRAGIESIGRGQMEAARSLGMSYFQAMRYIILPQALRQCAAAAGQRLRVDDQGLVAGVGVRRARYDAGSAPVCRPLVSVS